jgi:hypothetical protein
MLLKLFHKIEKEGTILNIFYKARVTLILKPMKATTPPKRLQTNFLMNLNAKILNKILAISKKIVSM